MEPLSLFRNNKERQIFFLVIFTLFSLNIALLYNEFQEFKKEEVSIVEGKIANIYPKENYQVLKIQTDNFTFFTSASLNFTPKKLQDIHLYLITENISFIEYLKGFYAKSFNLIPLEDTKTFKNNLYDFIANQHQNSSIASLYTALFLATNIDNEIRQLCSNLGISHLVAISGFHLGVISFVLYFILHLFYAPIHQRYFPYRNKRFDIMVFISVVLFGYLLLVDLVPSLLRAFVMFIFGLFLLRNNIKLLSFETLLIIVMIILAIFPKLLFSLSLWFSVAGVFYIFLFLHYFKTMNRYLQLLFFNFWIYLAMNPIVHYFFPLTSYEQLLSPILTLLFTLFYPLVLALHLLGFGDLFNPILEYIISIEIFTFDKPTSLPFFVAFIALSFGAIFSKKAFIGLNIALASFSFYLFFI